jgi:hypothetical protein
MTTTDYPVKPTPEETRYVWEQMEKQLPDLWRAS